MMGKSSKKDIFINFTGIVLLVLAIGAMAAVLLHSFGEDIWYDEVFSVIFASKDFKSIVELTSRDVHPPLYYFYLKLISTILRTVFPGMKIEIASKLASAVPWLVILVLSLTMIRKRFGILVSGFFMLLITAMPQIENYYVEIRMYSFALMLVTGAGCALFSLLDTSKKRTERISALVAFFLCGVATAYTQYYALIAVAGLYLVLLICIIIGRKREPGFSWALFILPALMSVISYIPWIPYFLSQLKAVEGSYWIQPLTLRSIPGCVKYLYLPVSGDGVINYVAAGAMILISAAMVVTFLLRKPSWKEIMTGMSGFVVLLCVIASGFVLSLAGRPIFVYRYMIPAMGIYCFSLAYMLSYLLNKGRGVWLLSVIPFVFGCYMNMKGFHYEEQNKKDEMENTRTALENIPDGSVVITNFDQLTVLMDYYIPACEIYLYDWDVDSAAQFMLQRGSQKLPLADTADFIKKSLEAEKRVYFFGSFNSRDEVLEEWEKDGVFGAQVNSCLLERYWFNIYEISLNENGADYE